MAVVFMAATLVFAPAGISNAQTLQKLIPQLLEKHPRVRAAKADLEAANQGESGARAAFFPALSLTTNIGHEEQNKPASTADTSTAFNEVDLTATQLVYDFGKTSADVGRAGFGVKRAEHQLEKVSQSLALEGISAFLNLLRAVDTLGYAKQSENSIKRQTGLEESRVQRGSGIATDVLQAKAQLAGANANRIRADGALVNAINRYRAVFQEDIGNIKGYRRPRLPFDRLPKALDDAIKIAAENNLDLAIAQSTERSAERSVASSRSTLFYPKIELVGESKFKHNVGGTLEDKIEKLVKFELTYPLFTGGRDLSTYRGALQGRLSAQRQLDNLRLSVEEQVRNAWQNLQTSRSNAGFLRNQANIAGEFLDLARKERQLGRRSLIDVLNGEVNFIQSISSAVSAETDMALAIFNLLFAMGDLGGDLVQTLDAAPAGK